MLLVVVLLLFWFCSVVEIVDADVVASLMQDENGRWQDNDDDDPQSVNFDCLCCCHNVELLVSTSDWKLTTSRKNVLITKRHHHKPISLNASPIFLERCEDRHSSTVCRPFIVAFVSSVEQAFVETVELNLYQNGHERLFNYSSRYLLLLQF